MDNDIKPAGEQSEIFHTQAEIFLSEFTCNAFNLIHAELPEIGRAIIFEPIKDGGHGNLIVKALPGRGSRSFPRITRMIFSISGISRIIFSMTPFPKNPVVPVIMIRLPANCSFTDISLLVNMNSLLLIRIYYIYFRQRQSRQSKRD